MLNTIKDNEGARKRRMRVGRGIGSGKGKTCGRGGKGQTARTGVAINGFEGGQMPIHRRLPKRGFSNIFRTEYAVINTGDLQRFVDAKRIKADAEVTSESLQKLGLLKGSLPLKLLAKGELKTKLKISVDKASKAAIAAVEKAGGSVTVLVTEEAAA
ncbi:MAG: 50S ribosomal protein L15 [Alphaproteobacteria bacterium]|nr:50S ribosomal protein L15 [Alphaproteobacteria bacterium]